MTTLPNILKATSQHFAVTQKSIVGRVRGRTACDARSVVCYLAKRMTRKAYREIGEFLAGRDHATIVRLVDLVHRHKELRDAAREIEHQLEFGAMPCKCPRCVEAVKMRGLPTEVLERIVAAMQEQKPADQGQEA